MNLPLLAVDVKSADYAWTPTETEPAPAPMPTVAATAPSLFMPELFNADPLEWSKKYVDSLMSTPNWQEELVKRNLEAKRRRREARIAQRQKAA